MTKITLNDLSTISGNEQSAINLINTNNALIETASDNTLSRDGTSPNQMLADLDMNSFHILNLANPVLSNDPVRLQDMITFAGGGTIAAFPTTSNALRTVITDETGTGSLTFATSPTLVTPILGAATGTTLTLTGTGITLSATNSGIELGSTASSNTPFIDFHSSGNVNDFDARMIGFGGSASPGTGGLSFIGSAGFVPNTSDSVALGNTTNMWSDLFLADGGVINWNNGNTTLTHSAGLLASNVPLSILSGTAVPAGGTTGSGYKLSSVSNLGIFFGSGLPTLSAAQGSLYIRTDGSTTITRLYVNTNGSTTWTNVVTSA